MACVVIDVVGISAVLMLKLLRKATPVVGYHNRRDNHRYIGVYASRIRSRLIGAAGSSACRAALLQTPTNGCTTLDDTREAGIMVLTVLKWHHAGRSKRLA
jgi:hypothetical protein